MLINITTIIINLNVQLTTVHNYWTLSSVVNLIRLARKFDIYRICWFVLKTVVTR